MNVCMYVHTYACDPVRLRIRHLYQVEPELFKSSYFPNYLIYLVHIWFDGRYRSKVSFSNTPTHTDDLKVKVMDLEIFNVKDSG